MNQTLSQQGLVRVLHKLVRESGKVVVPASYLRKPDKGAALIVEYHSAEDVFVLTSGRVEQSPILLPNRLSLNQN